MSERKTYRTIAKTVDSQADVFIINSTSGYNIGAFFIFTGLVGGVPLYYMFSALVLRIGNPNLFPGLILSLLIIAVGIFAIFFATKQVKVFNNGKGGSISIKDGVLAQEITYTYGETPKIRLSVSEVNNGKIALDNWEITLMDGRCQFLLDLRMGRLQESKALAEFLAKSMRCDLLVVFDAVRSVTIPYTDVDLPYCLRVKKYPILASPHPRRPDNCPVKVEDINYGLGRRYSWGLMASGVPTELIGLIFAVIAVGITPFWKVKDHYVSFLSESMTTGDWSFFIGAAALIAVLCIVEYGYRSVIEINEQRINIRKELWGLAYYTRSFILDNLEEILTRKTDSQNCVVFASDNLVVSMRVSGPDIADYLAADIQYFLTSGQAVADLPAAPQV